MKRDSDVFVATVGTVFLAVMCCVGLPLIAAVGASALFGGLGVAVFIAIVASVGLVLRWRQGA